MMERRKSRIAYWLNPVYWGVLQVVQSYVIGDAFSWSDHPDRRVRETVDELAAVNNLPDLAERFWTEFMLDGENATVWTGRLRPSEPAQLAFLDVDRGLEVEFAVSSGVTRLESDRESWDAGEFVWSAFDSLYNDPRGWPLARHAVDACVAYVGLLNARLRTQDINGRLNAVYKAIVNTKSQDGGAAQLAAKAALYGRIPRDGAVVTLAMDPDTGRSESLEMLDLARGAADAASDGRLVRLVIATVFGLPEHYLGEGGNVNRSTSDAMGDPARRGLLRKQAIVRSWLDRVVRTELVRRDGEDATYEVPIAEVRDDGRTRSIRMERVPASRIEIPWVFPDLTTDDIQALTRLVDMATTKRIMSMQTARDRLGLDPAVEQERIQIETGADPSAAVATTEATDEAPNTNDDDVFAARIAHADDLATELNEQRPDLGLHWAHIITGPGAATAPGAYLQGALPKDASGERVDVEPGETPPEPQPDAPQPVDNSDDAAPDGAEDSP